MNQLIPIQTVALQGSIVQTVNARDLHAFLGVRKDFSDWIKVQLERARLIEGRDYITQLIDSPVNPHAGEKGLRQGRPRTDYHLTLDASKHVAMLANTDKGFEVREYFIACEQRLKDQQAAAPKPTPVTTLDALKATVVVLDEHDARLTALESLTRHQSLEIAKLQIKSLSRPRPMQIVPTHQQGLDLDPPAAPKALPQGGTHASPAPHERRGHYRQLTDGRRVWVRETRVGKHH